MSTTCLHCDSPLGHPSSPANRYTHYCYQCKTCTICKNVISPTDLAFNEKYSNELGEKLFVHTLCLTPELRSELENRKVVVTDRELDLLNAAHLMVQPDVNLSIDTNTKDAELKGISWFNSLPSLDEKYLALRRIESLAACFSLLMKKEPGTATLRISLNAKSSERFKESVRAESKKDAKHIPCQKCGQKFLEPEIVEHFKNCVGAPPKTKEKVAKRTRTAFEKMVDMAMSYGMTAKEAMESTKAAFEAQGREITYSDENEIAPLK